MLDYRCTGIQKFIFDRIYQIQDEIVFNDPEHREMGKEPQQLMEQLNAKLTPEDQKILDRFDCARTERMNRQDEIIYSQALMDGILIGYWVAMVGQGVEKIEV
jgi:hypothetical protein